MNILSRATHGGETFAVVKNAQLLFKNGKHVIEHSFSVELVTKSYYGVNVTDSKYNKFWIPTREEAQTYLRKVTTRALTV